MKDVQTVTFPNGMTFEGHFDENGMATEGVVYNKNNDVLHKGKFENGKTEVPHYQKTVLFFFPLFREGKTKEGTGDTDEYSPDAPKKGIYGPIIINRDYVVEADDESDLLVKHFNSGTYPLSNNKYWSGYVREAGTLVGSEFKPIHTSLFMGNSSLYERSIFLQSRGVWIQYCPSIEIGELPKAKKGKKTHYINIQPHMYIDKGKHYVRTDNYIRKISVNNGRINDPEMLKKLEQYLPTLITSVKGKKVDRGFYSSDGMGDSDMAFLLWFFIATLGIGVGLVYLLPFIGAGIGGLGGLLLASLAFSGSLIALSALMSPFSNKFLMGRDHFDNIYNAFPGSRRSDYIRTIALFFGLVALAVVSALVLYFVIPVVTSIGGFLGIFWATSSIIVGAFVGLACAASIEALSAGTRSPKSLLAVFIGGLFVATAFSAFVAGVIFALPLIANAIGGVLGVVVSCSMVAVLTTLLGGFGISVREKEDPVTNQDILQYRISKGDNMESYKSPLRYYPPREGKEVITAENMKDYKRKRMHAIMASVFGIPAVNIEEHQDKDSDIMSEPNEEQIEMSRNRIQHFMQDQQKSQENEEFVEERDFDAKEERELGRVNVRNINNYEPVKTSYKIQEMVNNPPQKKKKGRNNQVKGDNINSPNSQTYQFGTSPHEAIKDLTR